jgi:hypothetical protein
LRCCATSQAEPSDSRRATSQHQRPGLHQYNGRNFCLRCTPNWSRLPNDYTAGSSVRCHSLVALKRYNRRWSPLADDYTAGSSVRCHNLVAFNHHNRRRSRPPTSQRQGPGLHQYNGRNFCRRCCTAELVPLAERLHLEAAPFRCHSLVALKRYNRRRFPLDDVEIVEVLPFRKSTSSKFLSFTVRLIQACNSAHLCSGNHSMI